MPTRTQQGDLLSIAYLSHGDTKHIALFPANPEECFYLAVQAFDLAERFQTPVFVVTDLDIGMNDWMCRRLKWDDSYRPDRGKVLGAAELAEVEEVRPLRRHRRWSAGADAAGRASKGRVLHARLRAHVASRRTPRTPTSTARWWTVWRASWRPPPSTFRRPRSTREDDATLGIISIGGCHAAVREALRSTARATESRSTTCASAAFPSAATSDRSWRGIDAVSSSSRTATRSCARCSRSRPATPLDKMIPVLDYGGMPLTADFVVSEISGQLRLLDASRSGAHDAQLGGAMRGVE